MFSRFDTIPECDRQTHRHTTMAYTALSIASRGKNVKYYTDMKELEEVQEEKDLGILITNDLKASGQCVQACNKANSVLADQGRC